MKKKKKWPLVLALLVVCVLIAVIPLLSLTDAEFGGADDQAGEIVEEISPDYEPWAQSILELSSETESLLFCLQAAIGGGILGFGFGYLRARKVFGGASAPEVVTE